MQNLLVVLPYSSSSPYMSPVERDLGGYFWDLAESCVIQWLETLKSRHPENGLLPEDPFVVQIIQLEVRNMLFAWITNERLKGFLAKRTSTHKFNEKQKKKLLDKLAACNVSRFTIEDLEKELDWSLEMISMAKRSREVIFLESWYASNKVKKKKLRSEKAICLWHFVRIEAFLEICDYNIDFAATYSLLKEIKKVFQLAEKDQNNSEDVFDIHDDPIITKILKKIDNFEFNKRDFSLSYFNRQECLNIFRRESEQLADNLIKYELRVKSPEELTDLSKFVEFDSEFDSDVDLQIKEGQRLNQSSKAFLKRFGRMKF